ncbi:hypothetical protein [Streptomyces sp. NPDC001537]
MAVSRCGSNWKGGQAVAGLRDPLLVRRVFGPEIVLRCAQAGSTGPPTTAVPPYDGAHRRTTDPTAYGALTAVPR